jgi:hypothetical protein
MKKWQFSLRKLFAVTAIIAICLGVLMTQRHRVEIARRTAATANYIAQVELYERSSLATNPAELSRARKWLDDTWKKHYPSWPVPDVPSGRYQDIVYCVRHKC